MPQSWWLKVKRAQRHMIEIEVEIRRYTEKHAYRPVRITHGKRKRNVWSYKLELTEQPNPMIAAMLGDFLFDLRSALDHMISACAPNRREQRSFPIVYKNVFLEGADAKARQSFVHSLSGLRFDAQAIVVSFQPWESPVPQGQPIGIISRLNNRDKHRELVVVATGARNTQVSVQTRDWYEEQNATPAGRFVQADAVVVEFTDTHTPPLSDAEVSVQLHATPMVYVEVSHPDGNRPPDFIEIRHLMLGSIRQVRDILRQMQPYIRR